MTAHADGLPSVSADAPSGTLPSVDASVPDVSASLAAPEVPSADVTPVEVSSSVPVVNLAAPEPLSGTSTLASPALGLPPKGDVSADVSKPTGDMSMPDVMPGEVPSPHGLDAGAVPSASVDVPSASVDVPSVSVDEPSASVDVPSVDAPAASVEAPSANMDPSDMPLAAAAAAASGLAAAGAGAAAATVDKPKKSTFSKLFSRKSKKSVESVPSSHHPWLHCFSS